MQKIISVTNGVPRMEQWRMAEPVNFESCDGEQIAVIGPNGSGKSMLIDIITGRHPLLMQNPEYDFSPRKSTLVSDNIKYVTFRDTYGADNDRTYFLQQRWEQQEINEDTPTVGQCLDEAYQMAEGGDTTARQALRKKIYTIFHLEELLDKYIILLSSGELRKLKLATMLFSQPRVLIIDNPFIGLDSGTCQQLRLLLATIAKEGSLQLILVVSRASDIPDFITHVVEVKGMRVMPKMTRNEFLAHHVEAPHHVLDAEKEREILSLPKNEKQYHTDVVAQMNHVSIRYGKRTILKDLNLTVHTGEHWALSGENGSGKSTLLSLVCADNPQSYACDIMLFGHPRGSGESIWDIKKHIGYVSPEMHRAYQRDMPCLRIVAGGMVDSVGLYVKPREDDYERIRFWMRMFGVDHLADTSFLRISSGEQRLVLLARAFVKDPELLILDEPLHGLDTRNRQKVKDIIDTFCRRDNKTLIMVAHFKDDLPECIDHSLHLAKHR